MSSLDLVHEFEQNLRAHLDVLLEDVPPPLLKLKLRDFLKLSGIPVKGNTFSGIGQTPKRRTGRVLVKPVNTPNYTPLRSHDYDISASANSTPLARASLNTTFPLLPQTPSNRSSIAQTPRLTIKSSVHHQLTAQKQHEKQIPPVSGIKITKSRQTPARNVSKTPFTATKNTAKTTTTNTSSTSAMNVDENDDKGIVQFQLRDGNVVDVDFSRSPRSALQSANLLGSEAIGEVKAKIETYATQFMQYLKFFKKLKP